MKLKWISLCAAIVMIMPLDGQSQKIKFNSINAGGLIIGQSKVDGLFQSVNGFRFQKWFAGFGAGMDYYYYKSIPLFIDARRYFGKQDDLFVYADLGYNIPWRNKPGEEVFYYNSYHFTGGAYTDAGVGYGFNSMKNVSLLISGGFSYKRIRNKVGITHPCINPPCPEDINTYQYDLNRFVLKAGIRFN